MKNIIQHIIGYRKRAGLTQSQLAYKANISLATLQNIEAGRANPSLQTVTAILDILGIELFIQSKEIDWDYLGHFGVPLMQAEEGHFGNPTREELVKALTRLAVMHKEIEINSREGFALVSFLSALATHYPSIWQLIKKPWKDFLFKHKNKLDPKLRRLSLESLSSYL